MKTYKLAEFKAWLETQSEEDIDLIISPQPAPAQSWGWETPKDLPNWETISTELGEEFTVIKAFRTNLVPREEYNFKPSPEWKVITEWINSKEEDPWALFLEKLLTNDSRFSAHYGEEARKILDYIKINAEENIKSAWWYSFIESSGLHQELEIERIQQAHLEFLDAQLDFYKLARPDTFAKFEESNPSNLDIGNLINFLDSETKSQAEKALELKQNTKQFLTKQIQLLKQTLTR